jgi:hypothetical protein
MAMKSEKMLSQVKERKRKKNFQGEEGLQASVQPRPSGGQLEDLQTEKQPSLWPPLYQP